MIFYAIYKLYDFIDQKKNQDQETRLDIYIHEPCHLMEPDVSDMVIALGQEVSPAPDGGSRSGKRRVRARSNWAMSMFHL